MSRKPALLSDPDDLLTCAETAARKAGAHALHQSRRRNEVIQLSAHDVKLKLDQECQAVAEHIIRARFPQHRILGEESGGKQLDTGIVWVIDPIDGTVNYFHGLPLWCCSVAIRSDGKTVAGAVYAPVLDECYTARIGKPARCNGKRMAVSATRRIEQAIVATGLNKQGQDSSDSMAFFRRLSTKIQRLRIMGSAALDICHVACGKADGYFESGIYLWDIAAGSLIVEQAGGRSEILDRGNGHRISFMATNGHLHDSLKELLVPVPHMPATS